MRLLRNIRHMEEKPKGGSISKVTTNDNGVTVEYTDNIEIKIDIAQNNEATHHQTEGGSQLLSPPFLGLLGRHGEGRAVTEVVNSTFISPPMTASATKDFLLAFKYDNEAKQIAVQKDILSRYKEQTSSWGIGKVKTSTHHRYIGHYKPIFKDKILT